MSFAKFTHAYLAQYLNGFLNFLCVKTNSEKAGFD